MMISLTERIAALSAIWSAASYVFPRFQDISTDWDEAYREYIEKAAETENDKQFYLLLAEFISLLQDGHTDISFPKAMLEELGYFPFELMELDGAYYVKAAPESCREILLEKVTEINGVPMARWIEKISRYIHMVEGHAYKNRIERILPFFLRKRGNEIRTEGHVCQFDLTAAPAAEKIGIGSLRPSYALVPVPAAHIRAGYFMGGILYVKVDNFLSTEAAAEFTDLIRTASPDGPSCADASHTLRGVILDIRENIGGMTATAAQYAWPFFRGTFRACRKRTRENIGIDIASASQYGRMSEEEIENCVSRGLAERKEVELSQNILRRVQFREYTDGWEVPEGHPHLECPCVLLTSRNTISAAEDFAAMFRSNHRAVIAGSPTYGSTGTPMLLRIPGGGTARICSVAYRLLDGTEFINRGIFPDYPVTAAYEGICKGQDTVLDFAVRLLAAGQTARETAHEAAHETARPAAQKTRKSIE